MTTAPEIASESGRNRLLGASYTPESSPVVRFNLETGSRSDSHAHVGALHKTSKYLLFLALECEMDAFLNDLRVKWRNFAFKYLQIKHLLTL
jgi:hypothetical protein